MKTLILTIIIALSLTSCKTQYTKSQLKNIKKTEQIKKQSINDFLIEQNEDNPHNN